MTRLSVEGFQIFIDGDTVKQIQEVVNDIYTGVVKRTPVRTGRARASWTVGIGAPDLTVAPVGGEPGNPQPAPKPPRLNMTKPKPVFIDNGLPYIQYLEFGSPTTEATGMVAATMVKYL